MITFEEALDDLGMLELDIKGPKFTWINKRVIKVHLHKDHCISEATGPRRFMFENKWMLEDGYNQAVRETWNNGEASCPLPVRIKECGVRLKVWANKNLGSIAKRIKNVSK
ncbi:hypothetical protein ACS0TY_022626 [Phlomoides rotata]